MPKGLVCVNCKEWFDVIYHNRPKNKLRYCPLCGYEFTDEELEKMTEDSEREERVKSELSSIG
jgi:hypothetical protein